MIDAEVYAMVAPLSVAILGGLWKVASDTGSIKSELRQQREINCEFREDLQRLFDLIERPLIVQNRNNVERGSKRGT